MQDQYEQLSFFASNTAMKVNGTKVKLLDIQQVLASDMGNFYATKLEVQSAEPLTISGADTYFTVTGSDVEALNGAQFYIGGMPCKLGRYYMYSLVGIRLLPRIT